MKVFHTSRPYEINRIYHEVEAEIRKSQARLEIILSYARQASHKT